VTAGLAVVEWHAGKFSGPAAAAVDDLAARLVPVELAGVYAGPAGTEPVHRALATALAVLGADADVTGHVPLPGPGPVGGVEEPRPDSEDP
jgi:hypothetical protein